MCLQLTELGEGKSEKALRRTRTRAVDVAASTELTPASETSPQAPRLPLRLDCIPSRGEAGPHLPEESVETQEARRVGTEAPSPGLGWLTDLPAGPGEGLQCHPPG